MMLPLLVTASLSLLLTPGCTPSIVHRRRAAPVRAATMDTSSREFDGHPAAQAQNDIDAAVAEVEAAAAAFGEDTQAYARKWTARLLADGTLAADGDVGLIEECLIDDGQEQCMRLEAAIVNLRKLVGSDFAGLNS